LGGGAPASVGVADAERGDIQIWRDTVRYVSVVLQLLDS
jgi:hypothetical protein